MKKYLFFVSCLLLHQALVSGSSSSYNYVTTIQASIPNIQDEFGSKFSLVVNGTTLILAASVPNLVTDPHVEIFKSEDNGQTWIYSQSISCCPTSRSLYGYFSTSFSENGTMLLIGNPISDVEQGGAMLYYYSNGQYVNSSQDLTCNNPNLYEPGNSVALSGDGTWAFVGVYSGMDWDILVYTNMKTSQCSLLQNSNIGRDDDGTLIVTTNFDGSTLIIGFTPDQTSMSALVYTDFSYQSSTTQPTSLNFNFPITLSLIRDGSIFAVGLCGCCVYIYIISELTSPLQIITPPPVSIPWPFGCNVDLSDDGIRLVVGSGDIHGYSYAYKNIGGVYQFDMLIIPPFTDGGVGGGLAIVNTPDNTSVILIGGPTSGILESGQIAVFKSVPAMSVTATPTASAMSTYSATSSSTASASSSSSATATSTASATGTSTATPTSNSTTTPSSQPNNNIQPGANSPLLGITTGISITGGIIGSIIGYFLIRWIKKWYKSNKRNKKNYTPYISIESINNETSSTGKESLITELYST